MGITPNMAPSALMTRTGEMRICSFTLKPRSIGPMTSSSGTRTREPSPKRDASARLGGGNSIPDDAATDPLSQSIGRREAT